MAASERYVPAAGRRAFTRLYDPAIARAVGGAEVIGVDGDPEILTLAREDRRGCGAVAQGDRVLRPGGRLLADAGLSTVALHARLRTGWGSLELLSARRA